MNVAEEHLQYYEQQKQKNNSPDYYKSGDGKFEAIDFIDAFELNFNLGNVIKYIARASKKTGNDYINDLIKAHWYITREMSHYCKKEGINCE